jgi:hypothetical protein
MWVGSRGSVTQLLVALVSASWLALLSCAPDGTLDARLLVFPAEAELGGSAAAVISSNHVPGADADELYTLTTSRVGVQIEDADDVLWNATVRSVFPLAIPPTSYLADEFPGGWVIIVLFDLPDDSGFDLGTGPPFSADVVVSIDSVAMDGDPEAIGSIRITGTGGQPTQVLWPPLADLELDSVVARYRARLGSGGFPAETGGTVIGGLEADLVYFSPCFTDAEVYAGTEGANAGVYLGPQKVVGGAGFYVYRRLVLTYPDGFTLEHPSSGAADALGEGPLIDITFDRPNQSLFDCASTGVQGQLWLWNVFAVRPDGTEIVDQRGTGSLGASSSLFTRQSIPAVP